MAIPSFLAQPQNRPRLGPGRPREPFVYDQLPGPAPGNWRDRGKRQPEGEFREPFRGYSIPNDAGGYDLTNSRGEFGPGAEGASLADGPGGYGYPKIAREQLTGDHGPSPATYVGQDGSRGALTFQPSLPEALARGAAWASSPETSWTDVGKGVGQFVHDTLAAPVMGIDNYLRRSAAGGGGISVTGAGQGGLPTDGMDIMGMSVPPVTAGGVSMTGLGKVRPGASFRERLAGSSAGVEPGANLAVNKRWTPYAEVEAVDDGARFGAAPTNPRFEPAATSWEMRSPHWPKSWFEDYSEGRGGTPIPQNQWNPKTIERAKLFVREQQAAQQADAILNPLMWDASGRNIQGRGRLDAEKLAMEHPEHRSVLEDHYAAKTAFYEHANPNWEADPYRALNYPHPPGDDFASRQFIDRIGERMRELSSARAVDGNSVRPGATLAERMRGADTGVALQPGEPSYATPQAVRQWSTPANDAVRNPDGSISYANKGNQPVALADRLMSLTTQSDIDAIVRDASVSTDELIAAAKQHAGIDATDRQSAVIAVAREGLVLRSARAKGAAARQTRTWANRGTQPLAAANALARSQLAMDDASRMARAKEMGFDTDQDFFHGTTSKFDAFKRIDGGNAMGRGYYFTPDEQTAKNYADGVDVNRITPTGDGAPRVLKTFLHKGKTFSSRDMVPLEDLKRIEQALLADKVLGRSWKKGELVRYFDRAYPSNGDNVAQAISYNADEVNRILRAAGYQSRRSGYGTMVFEPNQIRDQRATFDPAEASSANLLSANPLPNLPWQRRQEEQAALPRPRWRNRAGGQR